MWFANVFHFHSLSLSLSHTHTHTNDNSWLVKSALTLRHKIAERVTFFMKMLPLVWIHIKSDVEKNSPPIFHSLPLPLPLLYTRNVNLQNCHETNYVLFTAAAAAASVENCHPQGRRKKWTMWRWWKINAHHLTLLASKQLVNYFIQMSRQDTTKE